MTFCSQPSPKAKQNKKIQELTEKTSQHTSSWSENCTHLFNTKHQWSDGLLACVDIALSKSVLFRWLAYFSHMHSLMSMELCCFMSSWGSGPKYNLCSYSLVTLAVSQALLHSCWLTLFFSDACLGKRQKQTVVRELYVNVTCFCYKENYV